MISVVRLRESMIDSLHEYKLSYFVLMMLSLTFIAGAANLPLWAIWYNRWTPVIDSSTIPYKFINEWVLELVSADIFCDFKFSRVTRHTLNVPTRKIELNFLTSRWVASPPSSSTIFGCHPSALIHCSMHHQKSSSLSPLHAYTLIMFSASAAATSFWEEYMLHAAHRTYYWN